MTMMYHRLVRPHREERILTVPPPVASGVASQPTNAAGALVRFFEKVNKRGPLPKLRPELGRCWVWTAHKKPSGHGRFRFDGKIRHAFRFSYQMLKGEIPEGFEIDHLCMFPPCVNPDHLEAVTPYENKMRSAKVNPSNQKRTTLRHYRILKAFARHDLRGQPMETALL